MPSIPERADEYKTIATSLIEGLAAVVRTDQDMAKSLTKGLQLILKASHMDGGYIHLLDPEANTLRLRACLGLAKRTEKELNTVRDGEKVPGQVLHKAEPLIATNITEISDLSGRITQEKNQMLHAGFPLTWDDRVLGTLTVVSKNRRTLSEEDIEILKAFSQFMAAVVQNLTIFGAVCQGKRQWENAIDSISDLVVICDRDFRIIRTNKAILDRFWLPLEEAMGKECFDLLYNGNPFPVSRENLERMLRQGVTYHEEVAASRNGGIFSIFVSPILTSGRLTGSIHVIKEITHERFLEKDREELVRKVSLLAPGTITIDPEGRIRSWDSGASEILGYEKEEIEGKPLSMMLSSSESEGLLNRLEESGGILNLETTTIAKGNIPIRVGLIFSAHRDQKERLEEVTIFIRNITQQEEEKAKLTQSTRLTAMIETAADVSQKLGMMLEGMLAQIDGIEDRVRGPHEITTRLQRVATEARSAQEVLDRIRQLSKSRLGGDFRPLDTAELIRGIVEMAEREWSDLFRTRKIDFEIIPDPGSLPSTWGDPQQLLVAFDHLIRNSVEAMPDGGKLILRTHADQKWATLVLIDQGVGMTAKELGRAFDPFFTTRSRNLGLGLSIVYGIVRKHHGEVMLESKPGQGTEVTVRLPAMIETSNAHPPSSASFAPVAKKASQNR